MTGENNTSSHIMRTAQQLFGGAKGYILPKGSAVYNDVARAIKTGKLFALDARLDIHERAHDIAIQYGLEIRPAVLGRNVAVGFWQFDYLRHRSFGREAMMEGFAEWLRLRETDQLQNLTAEQQAADQYGERFLADKGVTDKLDRIRDMFRLLYVRTGAEQCGGETNLLGQPARDAHAGQPAKLLDLLKQHGSVQANNPEEDHILAGIAAAGVARKEGNTYFYTGNSASGGLSSVWEFVFPTEKQKKIIWAGVSEVPQLIACLMLVWALKPDNPYTYYVLLRWVCCAVFVYLALQALAQNKQGWFWVLGITAVIYNPIIRFHLTREIWQLINVITIGTALATIFNVRVRHEKDITAPTEPAQHKRPSLFGRWRWAPHWAQARTSPKVSNFARFSRSREMANTLIKRHGTWLGPLLLFGLIFACCGLKVFIWPPFAKYRDIELRKGMTEQEIINRLGEPDHTETPAGMTERRIVQRFIELDFGSTWPPGDSLPIQPLRNFETQGLVEPPGSWKVIYYSRIETGHWEVTRWVPGGIRGYRVSLLFLRGKLHAWKKRAEAASENK